MTDTGFEFKRNGDVLCHWRGDTYTIYAPTLGEMRQIDEYGQEIAEEIKANPAHQRATAFMEEMGEKGAENLDVSDDEAQEMLSDFNRLAREQALRWFVRVIQICGSDNWPRQLDGSTGQPMKDENGYDRIDTDALPAAVRNRDLVTQIKSHWWNVPLAESPNGATQTKIEAIG